MPITITTNNNLSSLHNLNLSASLTVPIVLLLLGATAHAQTVNQLLDSTYAFDTGNVIELHFDDASNPFDDRDIIGSEINACKLTALKGLFCLDGKMVRNWPNPARQAPASIDIADCRHDALGLDTRKETCTGMTVDRDGSIWLAGKNKGKTHSLIKLVEVAGADCPAPVAGVTRLTESPTRLWVPSVPKEPPPEGMPALCAYEYATGRPLIVDLTPVDGSAAEAFSLPGHPAPLKAIVGLEERKAAVAFLETGEVVEIVGDKKLWNLSGPEGVLGITLLQLGDKSDPASVTNLFLAATSTGRVLAYDPATAEMAWQAFDVLAYRGDRTAPAGCEFSEPVFSVRASNRTNTVLFTDSEYCEVLALQPGVGDTGEFILVNVTREGTGNLVVDTTGTIAPTGVTIAAGTSVDLSNCGDEPCPLAVDESGTPIATLSGVRLVDSSISGLALFQVEGMLDCRYVPHACIDLLGIGDSAGMTSAEAAGLLIAEGVIVPLLPASGDRLDPAAQRLNVTPMMPAEITDLFPGGMPDLLLPRYVRAQAFNGFRFGGFFGRTEDGVVFRDVFEGEFDIAPLVGSTLGCSENLGTLLWDVLASVSERYAAPRDPYAVSDPQYLGTITNSGCRNPTRFSAGDWSFKPYGLEPTPCTYNPDNASILWQGQGSCDVRDPVSGGTDVADDAVYAKLLLVLIDELDREVEQLACRDDYNDNGGVAPLNSTDCAFVQGKVDNAADKFYKCWDATKQPKQSSGDQNCQAFDSQLADLESTLGQITPAGTDVANRVGKLKARVIRMRHILETRFAPSVPDGGFSETAQ